MAGRPQTLQNAKALFSRASPPYSAATCEEPICARRISKRLLGLAFCALRSHIVAVRQCSALSLPSLGVSSLDLGRLFSQAALFSCRCARLAREARVVSLRPVTQQQPGMVRD